MDAQRTRADLRFCQVAKLTLVLILTIPAMAGASHRSANFVVTASTPQIAKAVADHAEVCRKQIARQWLGQEMEKWPIPCPIQVNLTKGEAGGLTSFGFDRNGVTSQEMSVEGRLDRILASALPHEITHTVFAAYFGGPMPRWADEGASLLSEDRRERKRHDDITLNLVQRHGNFPLDRLFRMEEYPKDLMGFYGQGYSVSRFLIEMGGRPRYLKFVKDGLDHGWDGATKAHFGLADVRELDRAWRSWHKVVASRGTPNDDLVVRAQSASE